MSHDPGRGAPSSLTARFPALRHRDLALLLGGQLVSLTGTQMQQVAVVWQLYLFTRSPWALGLLGLFRVLPLIVFALGGGVVADVFDRRRLMIATQSTLALVSVALAVLSATGAAGAWALYAAAALTGAAAAFDGPARQALLPLLVPREDLPSALALSAFVWQIATVVGPAVGGVVLAWTGVVPIYALDAASFLAVIGALLAMRHRAPPRSGAAVGLSAVLEGLRFMRRAPIIRTTMLLDFVATFFGGSMLLMPIFADQLLAVGPRGLGLLYAAQPAGAALAGLVLSSRGVPRRQGLAVLVSVAAYGLAVAVFGASRWFPLSLLALAASGAADTVSMVIRQTLRQLLTPDALRGRMTSINMIFFAGGPQLGEVEAGAVARAFGARVSVASGGLLCVVAVAATALLAPSLRRYESAR
ncbi:MFS transporter [Anaeromyxobacter diazotrophicus]|uniref:MFS transporter n=1 Tax=Anaeromyxobacter diazotrophicus TaxID=2590199 RepID=A0A7I9VKW1_9BACT|nr:MFS transporter [Anaeromyxobacter diazotrophicus]GEJ57031.1 MFS transporter [Anaeromyxobacter diazotrophicus]